MSYFPQKATAQKNPEKTHFPQKISISAVDETKPN